MEIIIYFTIYLIITSLLGWFTNRPKSGPWYELRGNDNEIIFSIDSPGGTVKDIDDITKSLTAGLSTGELKRFNKAICQLGINFNEAEKAIIKLKTAMDKVCDGK